MGVLDEVNLFCEEDFPPLVIPDDFEDVDVPVVALPPWTPAVVSAVDGEHAPVAVPSLSVDSAAAVCVADMDGLRRVDLCPSAAVVEASPAAPVSASKQPVPAVSVGCTACCCAWSVPFVVAATEV